ncbi:MAG: hypothetical protein EVA65_15880 [Oceanococcus sp.]|nr:MAG: hypothetical protein EVA65_15880 [Oceanococcus sp.]
MAEIYLVLGLVDYEGSSPIAAFMEREGADEFCERCNAYNSTPKPAPPSVEDDELWGDFTRQMDVWRKRHPAGLDGSINDRFIVAEVPLVAANA